MSENILINKSQKQNLSQRKDQEYLVQDKQPQGTKSKFIQRLTKIILLITVLAAGASAIFIIINVFMFAIDAYQMGRIINFNLQQNIDRLVTIICKYLILFMFATALITGSLIPFALTYLILTQTKVGSNKM